jgi:hypothetical protein
VPPCCLIQSCNTPAAPPLQDPLRAYLINDTYKARMANVYATYMTGRWAYVADVQGQSTAQTARWVMQRLAEPRPSAPATMQCRMVAKALHGPSNPVLADPGVEAEFALHIRRTPLPLSAMRARHPALFARLQAAVAALEAVPPYPPPVREVLAEYAGFQVSDAVARRARVAHVTWQDDEAGEPTAYAAGATRGGRGVMRAPVLLGGMCTPASARLTLAV